MPSKKPRVQTILSEELYTRFKQVCEKEFRTESQMAAIIIGEYIKEYEAKQERAEHKRKLEQSSTCRTG